MWERAGQRRQCSNPSRVGASRPGRAACRCLGAVLLLSYRSHRASEDDPPAGFAGHSDSDPSSAAGSDVRAAYLACSVGFWFGSSLELLYTVLDEWERGTGTLN